jgi:transcriptional regulator with XRE-family HTH domain
VRPCNVYQLQKVSFVGSDQGPVVQSALLRGELVRLRKEKGLTQEQVAQDLEWSASKLIRVEGGRSQVSKVDLEALLTQYGVTSESTRERLQLLNRGARAEAWWDEYRSFASPSFVSYVGFETGATFIRQFQPGLVPDLLQTAEYAEAVIADSPDAVHAHALVPLRLKRQLELAQRDPRPRQHYVVDEAAIRRQVGVAKSPDIMRDQLLRLADRAERDDLVTIQVLPFDAGAHRGPYVPFTVLEFDGELPDLLYVDIGRGEYASVAREDGPRIAEYRHDFDLMVEDALPSNKSIELIRDAAEGSLADPRVVMVGLWPTRQAVC